MKVLFSAVFAIFFMMNPLAAGAADGTASCSVGTTQVGKWYQDVPLPSSLAINPKTYEVEVVSDRDLQPEGEIVVLRVGLNWISPRFVPKDIFISSSTHAAIGKGQVTYIDILNNLYVYCAIKGADETDS